MRREFWSKATNIIKVFESIVKVVMEVMKNKQEQQQEMQQNRNVIHQRCSKMKGRKREKKHTQILRGSPLSKATSTGGKTESFYY